MNAIVTVMGWLSVFPKEIQEFVVAWKNLSVDELFALDEHEFERRQQVRETVRVLDALEGIIPFEWKSRDSYFYWINRAYLLGLLDGAGPGKLMLVAFANSWLGANERGLTMFREEEYMAAHTPEAMRAWEMQQLNQWNQ